MTVFDAGLQVAFALRLMRKTPGLTAVATLCLAVGIEIATACWGPARRALAVDPIERMRQE